MKDVKRYYFGCMPYSPVYIENNREKLPFIRGPYVQESDLEAAHKRIAELEAFREAVREKVKEAKAHARWYCNKCGYYAPAVHNLHGPEHKNCDYYAAYVATIDATELSALLESTK